MDLADLLHEDQDVGLTGLTYYRGKIYLAVQTGRNPRILVFDRHLECVETIAHPDFSDIHSLCIANGALLVVSTGNQSVIAVDLKDHTATTLFRTDHKIHINSVILDNIGLLACCQSPRHLFGTATHGGVIDITNQRVIVDGLGYPHSLLANGKKSIVLDSSGGRVIRFDRSGIVQQQALSGFLARRGDRRWMPVCRGQRGPHHLSQEPATGRRARRLGRVGRKGLHSRTR